MMVTVLWISLATAAMAVTLTKASVFEWLRSRVTWPWLKRLLHCHYCASHWIAIAMVAIYQPRIVQGGSLLVDLFVSAMVVVACSSPIAWVVYRAYQQIEPGPSTKELEERIVYAEQLVEEGSDLLARFIKVAKKSGS